MNATNEALGLCNECRTLRMEVSHLRKERQLLMREIEDMKFQIDNGHRLVKQLFRDNEYLVRYSEQFKRRAMIDSIFPPGQAKIVEIMDIEDVSDEEKKPEEAGKALATANHDYAMRNTLKRCQQRRHRRCMDSLANALGGISL